MAQMTLSELFAKQAKERQAALQQEAASSGIEVGSSPEQSAGLSAGQTAAIGAGISAIPTGSAESGASIGKSTAQGAAAGAAFGPEGAAIGAAVGALGGVLGARAARKQRIAAAQQRSQENIANIIQQQGAAGNQALSNIIEGFRSSLIR